MVARRRSGDGVLARETSPSALGRQPRLVALGDARWRCSRALDALHHSLCPGIRTLEGSREDENFKSIARNLLPRVMEIHPAGDQLRLDRLDWHLGLRPMAAGLGRSTDSRPNP